MMTASEIRDRIVAARVCDGGSLRGYDDDEIGDLERDAGLTFPEQYREFLRAAGKDAPGLVDDDALICGDRVLLLNQDFEASLRHEIRAARERIERDLPRDPEVRPGNRALEGWSPPANIFCFAWEDRGFESFRYFVCDGCADPATFQYDVDFGLKERGVLSAFLLELIEEAAEERGDG